MTEPLLFSTSFFLPKPEAVFFFPNQKQFDYFSKTVGIHSIIHLGKDHKITWVAIFLSTWKSWPVLIKQALQKKASYAVQECLPCCTKCTELIAINFVQTLNWHKSAVVSRVHLIPWFHDSIPSYVWGLNWNIVDDDFRQCRKYVSHPICFSVSMPHQTKPFGVASLSANVSSVF